MGTDAGTISMAAMPMPNWVTNRVEFLNQASYDAFCRRFLTDGEVDFGKVEPMPKGLENMPSTSEPGPLGAIAYAIDAKHARVSGHHVWEESLRRAADSVMQTICFMHPGARVSMSLPDTPFDAVMRGIHPKPDPESGLYPISGYEIRKITSYALDRDAMEAARLDYDEGCLEGFPDTYEKWGRDALGFLVMCGHMDWYSWSVDHWGVKWNASSTRLDPSRLSVTFDTPWSPVPRLMRRMTGGVCADAYYSFTDECFATYCGERVFRAGKAASSADYDSSHPSHARVLFDISSTLLDPCQKAWRLDGDEAVSIDEDPERFRHLSVANAMTPMRSGFLSYRAGGGNGV